eukprot:Platyproteum_vivax@DN9394_c0_g1_i1.p1
MDGESDVQEGADTEDCEVAADVSKLTLDDILKVGEKSDTVGESGDNVSDKTRSEEELADLVGEVTYVPYSEMGEACIDRIIELCSRDLSEPYSIWTYRWFLDGWPDLCFNAMLNGELVGCVISKLETHNYTQRGYIGMVAVDHSCRHRKIGTKLVNMSIDKLKEVGADEVVLETEADNLAALGLYAKLGFTRSKRLHNYYQNCSDAYRLKLLLPKWFSLVQMQVDNFPLLMPPVEP